MAPLVSIIMPLYNCEAYVLDSIGSILKQSYRNWELIIVDDRSTDNSYLAVKAFIADKPRIQLHQLKSNSGAAVTRNYAIGLAKGQFIAFLDSDDLWATNKLEEQLVFMKQRNSLLSFTGYQTINEAGDTNKGTIHARAFVHYKKLLKQNIIGCLTAMYDSSKIGKFYFDTTLDKHEDYQYWLEILKIIPQADGLNKSLAYYRIRRNSLSNNKLIAATYVWKILREYQKVPFLKTVYYFSCYAVNSVLKYYNK